MSELVTVRLSEYVRLSDYELRALAEWHADPARKNDMPPYLKYADHIRRAAELIEMAERQATP